MGKVVAYLSAAVVLLGVLGLLNLTLTLAAIRRLRQYGEQLSQQARFRPPPRIPPGTNAPEFSAATLAGGTRSLADLAGARSMIAFLSPQCAPCRTELADFTEFARSIPGGPAQVLAVLTGDEDEVAEFTEALNGVATVTVEPRQGPV